MDSSFANEFIESDDLISWLLLNPEFADFDSNQLPILNPNDQFISSSFDDTSFGDNLRSNSYSDSNDTRDTNFATGTSSSTKRKERSEHSGDKKSTKTGRKRQKGDEKDIETKVNELRRENADLQAHLYNVTQRTTEVQKQRSDMEKKMQAKLQQIGDRDDSDQSELAQLVKEYTDIYADYGNCRQREVTFHVNQLEKLIVPTLTTKMCLWALQQDKSFYQRSKSPMYDMLSKELEITSEQSVKIQERRERIIKLLKQLNESLALLESFKTAIEKKHRSYDSVCGRVQAAATPKQVVKFQLWITKNAHLLSRYIPDFSRSVHHTPNVEFIAKNLPLCAAVGVGSNNGEGQISPRSVQTTVANSSSSNSLSGGINSTV